MIHENVKFILTSLMTEVCCVWFKRRKGNAAHQLTSNRVPQPSSDKTLTEYAVVSLSREHDGD